MGTCAGVAAALVVVVVVVGVVDEMVCAGAGTAECATTPSAKVEAAGKEERLATRMSSKATFCGDCTDDRDELSLAASSSRVEGMFMA